MHNHHGHTYQDGKGAPKQLLRSNGPWTRSSAQRQLINDHQNKKTRQAVQHASFGKIAHVE